MIFTVKIPVTSYVRKFFLKEFGGEPLPVDQRNLLGNLLSNVMNDNDHRFRLYKPPGTVLEFKLSYRLKYLAAEPERCEKLGYYFEKYFKESLITYTFAFVRCGKSALSGIKDFLAVYDINDEDDFTLEAAQMIWSRSEKNNKFFSSHVILPFNNNKHKVNMTQLKLDFAA